MTNVLSPSKSGVAQLAAATNIPGEALRGQRRQAWPSAAASRQQLAAGNTHQRDKYAVVMETATLNELAPSVYCRRKALFVQQLNARRQSCRRSNAPLPNPAEWA